MKNLLIVANFKSNLSLNEAQDYLNYFEKAYKDDQAKDIIFCPSYPYLFFFKNRTEKFKKVFIGAQNVSAYKEGPFTGEVNGRQLKDCCSYCIVGHSERRISFSEDKSSISDKLKNLEENNITPILCVSEIDELNVFQEGKQNIIVAYEPLSAVGSGNPSNPKEADDFAALAKKKFGCKVLYGGSVDLGNVANFTSKDNIDGVLVGGESLDPQSFIEIINNAR